MSLRPGRTIPKDPNDEIVVEFDWTDLLQELGASATIASSGSTWTISDGPDSLLTKDNDSIVTGSLKTRVRLLDGTVNKKYRLTNTVVSNETPAQTYDRSVFIEVKNL